MKIYQLLVFLLFPVILKAQLITTIAGIGSATFSGDGGPATIAGIPNPADGVFDRYGNYYFADGAANRISKIDTAGIITTIAGGAMGGYGGDNGPATAARLYNPIAARLDSAGNIYIADAANFRIRKVNSITGIITTIAGTGTPSYCCDGGPATAADLYGIQGICLDKFGNLYIADGFNYRIRKVTPAGIISTFAGNGIPGYSGEGTLADTSMIGLGTGMCSDTEGNIYFANNSISIRVFKINMSGIMKTIAGNGSYTYSGDGIPATAANIGAVDMAVDNFNNLFLADKVNRRCYKIDATSGILYNIAGNGIAADSGDGGMATAASLNVPVGVALDVCGNLYIPTIGNGLIGAGRRIRKIIFNPSCDPYSHIDSVSLYAKSILTSEVSIYPNPAYGSITITATNKMNQIIITNLICQRVYSQTCDIEKAEVNIAGLPKGVYIVKVTDSEGKTTVSKILKE